MTRPATARRPPIREVADDKLRPFRDDVLREIMRLRKALESLESTVEGVTGGMDGAPTDSQYVLAAADVDLPNHRVLVDGTGTTVNTAVAGQIAIDAAAAAPTNASYVVIGLSAGLSAERVLTAGTGITVTDGGANGNATIATTITQYTDEMVDDRVAALLVEGNGIDLTYVDGSNTLTVAVDESELALQAPQYVCVTNTASLPNERALRAGHGIDLVDSGGGSNLTVDVDETELDPTLMDIQLSDIFTTLYEVNFSTLANNTLVDGAETIDGLAYVAANMGELGTAAVQNGTGIRFVAATSNGGATTMTSVSQLIPYIYVPLSQISGYNPMHEYIIEIYCSARILEANGEYVALGLWGVAGSPFAGSDARMRAAKLVRNAGDTADVMRVTMNATDDTGDVAIDTHDVIAIRVGPSGLGQAYSGAWAAGWPTSYTAHSTFATLAAADSPLNTGDVRIFMGLGCANDASPTTSVTIERMRIRRAL